MTITLDLQPEIEAGLRAQAAAHGMSLADYVKEIVVRECLANPMPKPQVAQAKDMVELFAPLRGLNIDLERDKDPGAGIELSGSARTQHESTPGVYR